MQFNLIQLGHGRGEVYTKSPLSLSPAVKRLFVGLVLIVASVCSLAQSVAVVTDGGGVARLFQGSASRMVEMLEPLPQGVRLQVDTNGTIVILYLETGVEFAFSGPGVVEVSERQLVLLSGHPPVRSVPPPSAAIRLRTDRLTQGGVVMRNVASAPVTVTDVSGSTLRPGDDAPVSRWVAYALWLEQSDSLEEAKSVWRRIANERPNDPIVVDRAR